MTDVPTTDGQAPVRIDRSSPQPYYEQLRKILLGRIENEWSSGDKLPSEAQFCDQYGVSRTVVRQTLAALMRDGFVHKVKGSGAFVSRDKVDLDHGFVQLAAGFYDTMRAQGRSVSSHILVQQIVPASVRIAQLLHLKIGEPVVQFDRLRFVDANPIEVVGTFMPAELVPGFVDIDMEGDRSLYQVLREQFSIAPSRGTRTVEAAAASEQEAALLQIAPGAPVLIMDNVTEDDSGLPFEQFHAVFRSDRTKLSVQFVAP